MGKHTPKDKWSSYEDKLLYDAVNEHGTSSWSLIASLVPGRNGKQCRERWIGQVNPNAIKSVWTEEEDRLLVSLQRIHGNKWALIASMMQGRSSINIKNRWGYLCRHSLIDCNQIMLSIPPHSISKPTKIILNPINLPNDNIFGEKFKIFQNSFSI